MALIVYIVGGSLALAFAAAGGAKLAGATMTSEAARRLGMPLAVYRTIGVLEIAGAVGIVAGLWPVGIGAVNFGVVAASCLFLLMVGAVGAHLRAAEPLAPWARSATLAVILCAFIGLRVAGS